MPVLVEAVEQKLKAPFPWFGGKSKAAHLIWQGLGSCSNYVEPFFGSGATLFGRKDYSSSKHTETINDLDCYLANFWRALQADPEAVAYWADSPVNEADLVARHQWLINQDDFKIQMKLDPDYFNAKVAGWWVWGLCSWIGSGWCKTPAQQMPHLGNGGQDDRPELYAYFDALATRLRRVRVCCGEWQRVLGPSITTKHGVTGVLLDPPYDTSFDVYAESNKVASGVRQWAITHGDNPLLRIALCGYADEHDMPSGWKRVGWVANKGYQGSSNLKRFEESIWFSPHCQRVHSDAEVKTLINQMRSYGRTVSREQAIAALKAS